MEPLLMTDSETVALGQRILGMTTTEFATVSITHTVSGITRIANNRILSGDDGETLRITIAVREGKKGMVAAQVDQRDDASLRAAVLRAEEIVRKQPGDRVDFETIPIGPQTYPPTSVWYERTARALDNERYTVAPQLIDAMNQAGLQGAAFVGGIARVTSVLRKDGCVALGRETDVECTLTVSTPDGSASGWAGTATRDWSKLNVTELSERAITLAKRAAHPVAFEPGRRVAILSSAALAQFARRMAYAFQSVGVEIGQSPLSKSRAMGGTKMGLHVLDSRLQMTSDPCDVDGGYLPFYKTGASAGLPVNRINWIENGILKNLSYSVPEALRRNRQHHMVPAMVRISPVPGTKTMTVDEMIANCQEGIFVNHIYGLDVVDGPSGVMTGVTRAGCFLIRNGKIEKALKNLRFADSPFFFLNNIEAIGAPERAAFGYMGDLEWPLPPVVVPPVMVRDFNFIALSDAV